MAQCRLTGLDEILELLEKLENPDDIAEKILFEGGNILKDEMRNTITTAADRGYATGELASSIVPTTPMKNNHGYFVAVRPVGTDSKGVRNGEKLQYLEHGTTRGQKGRPTIGNAGKRVESICAETAQEIFNKHVKL